MQIRKGKVALQKKVAARIIEEKEIFKVVYNKSKAEYTNKSFYQFDLNRDIKRRLKQQIREGKLDAFIL